MFTSQGYTGPLLVLLLITVFSHLILQTSSSIGYLGTKTANKCFSVAGVPRMDFNQCQPGEMVLIMDAVQGIGQRPGQCIYRHGDCTEPPSTETDAKLHDACIGRETCSIPVSVTWMGKCNAYSSYNYAIYQCIPRTEVVDVCARTAKTAFRTAFISSSGYPDVYEPGLECRCNITTDVDQRILLKFADYNLEWSENCANDVVEVTDGGSRMPRCGQLPRNYNITSRTNQVQLYFKSDEWQQRKGFWLTIEALGKIRISCSPTNWEPTTTTTTTTTTTAVTTPEEPDTTPDDDDYYAGGGNEFGGDGKDGKGGGAGGGYPYPAWAFVTPAGGGSKGAAAHGRHGGRLGPGPYGKYPSQADQDEFFDTTVFSNNQVGIIIGCMVALVLLFLLIFGAIWYKKRRQKEEISHIPNESSYLAKMNKRPLTEQHSGGLTAGYDVNPPPPPPGARGQY